MGSGAAFTSAALENSLEAGADFRVVVEDDLVVEPGIAFREGNNADNEFNPGSEESWARDNTDTFSLFSDDDSLNDISREDGPKVAAMNDATNSGLDIEVATFLAENAGRNETFEEFLQVANNGTTQRNVGIGFTEFGSDVQVNDSGSPIDADDVRTIYQFQNTDGVQISEQEHEDVAAWLTVEAGETRQIDLRVDTTNFYDEIVELATGTNPFDPKGRVTTVDLVDEISFGTEANDPQNPSSVE